MGFITFMAGAALNVLCVIAGFALFFAIVGKNGRRAIKGLLGTIVLSIEAGTIWLRNKLLQKLEKAPSEELEEDDPTKVDAHVI